MATKGRPAPPAIRFRTNAAKAVEVLLWLASKAKMIDFHRALKLLFFAEVRHLEEFGRPIIGDRYAALQYGPVAGTAYDILKGDPLILEVLGDEQSPFDPIGSYRVRPRREPNLDLLSGSDVEALEWAWRKYGALGFEALTKISHEHPAYAKAEAEGRYEMRYEDFLNPDDPDLDAKIEDLRETAPLMLL